MKSSRSVNKFPGQFQRIIILEGSPETELDKLAGIIKQEIPDYCKTVILPADLSKRDWNALELHDEVLETVESEPDKIIVITRLDVPERHSNPKPKDIEIYDNLELELGNLPTFAFFINGTRHYFIKQYNHDIGKGLLATEQQEQFDKAYRSTKHPRKLFLQATGYNLEHLATTILFQSHVYIKNPDITWDDLD